MCSEKVRQVGDDVAAVAAVDEETAQRAADLIKVEYQVLPGVFDPFEAMEENAPEVNWEGKGIHNIGMQSVMKAGTDIDEEFDRASYVQHRDYKTHRMVPCGHGAPRRSGYLQEWDLHHLDVHPDVLCGPVLVCPLPWRWREPGAGNQASCGRRFRRQAGFLFLWSLRCQDGGDDRTPGTHDSVPRRSIPDHAQPPPHLHAY